jgi:phospholipid/cholesterol/gamma-HCH transport system permease protein
MPFVRTLLAPLSGLGVAIDAALRGLVALCESLGYQIELFGAVLARLPLAPARIRAIADQLYQGAVQGVHVVLLVGLFMGMIVSLQTGIELSRIGQQDQIGTIVAVSMAREMGPFITATILAATAGSSMAAEIGTMAVSDELAALEVLSVDRVKFLVMPRLVALAIAAPLLTVLCDTIGILGGGFVAQSQLNVSYQLYTDTAIEALRDSGSLIPLPKDVYTGLFKAFVFGILIAVIGCAAGLRARGGALGVGIATRQAVRDSIITIIIANYFMTWFMYQA